MILRVPCKMQDNPQCLAKITVNNIEKIEPHEEGVLVSFRSIRTPLLVLIPYVLFKDFMLSCGKVFDERK